MSRNDKIIYLEILTNIKHNNYNGNKDLLKKDLVMLRKLMLKNQDNNNMKKIEKSMQLVLTRAC